MITIILMVWANNNSKNYGNYYGWSKITTLCLMGPSGTGKTYLAAGLIHDAVKAGYRAYFKTMEEIITMLRLKEMTTSAMNAYNRLLKAHLIAIDDIMLFPMKKNEAVAFLTLSTICMKKHR
jgi:DNA replication protein DnaC